MSFTVPSNFSCFFALISALTGYLILVSRYECACPFSTSTVDFLSLYSVPSVFLGPVFLANSSDSIVIWFFELRGLFIASGFFLSGESFLNYQKIGDELGAPYLRG